MGRCQNGCVVSGGRKRCEGTWTVRKVGGGDNRRRKRDWGGEEVWQKGPREPGP